MDKHLHAGVNPDPGFFANSTGTASSTQSVHADSGSVSKKPYQFNEQTNYVPKRTIITVIDIIFKDDLLKEDSADSFRFSLHVQALISWHSWTRRLLQPVYTSLVIH